MPDFYHKATQYSDSEAIKDYQDLVGSIGKKVGNKELYGAMNIQNQHIINDDAIRNQERMENISNTMQAIVKGEGAGAFLNPIGIIGGIEEATKLGAESQDLLNGTKDALVKL